MVHGSHIPSSWYMVHTYMVHGSWFTTLTVTCTVVIRKVENKLSKLIILIILIQLIKIVLLSPVFYLTFVLFI